jgi:replicative DNA helicase
MQYIRICNSLNDIGMLVPENEILSHIGSQKKDHYRSLYKYTDEHKKLAEEIVEVEKNGKISKRPRGVSGIEDVKSNFLVFDFDGENLNDAKNDTITVVERLSKQFKDVDVYFSGNKGFSVEILLDQHFTPQEYKSIVYSLAGDLKTFDTKIVNPSRIFRIPFTKHNVSGLYKTPITTDELKTLSINEIKAIAKDEYDYSGLYRNVQKTPELFQELKVKIKEEVKQERSIMPAVEISDFDLSDIDWTRKPKEFSNEKWLLTKGYFPSGHRNEAMMIIASTFKNLGYDKTQTYYSCKAAADAQSTLTGSDKFSKEEIYNLVINHTFSEKWKGGTYSIKDNALLRGLNEIIPEHIKKQQREDDKSIEHINDSLEFFYSYADDIDKNQVKMGIKPLDDLLEMQTGNLYAILAPPAVGKSSLAYQIINHSSVSGELCIFASYDMGRPTVIEKLLYKHLRCNKKELYRRYVEDKDFKNKIKKILNDNYANTQFIFKTGQTIDELKSSILNTEKECGRKARVVVVDYLELIQSKFSDPTQASMESIQGLREIAINLNIAVVVLLQPSKMGTTINQPITSYNAAKGSSSIAQAVTAMITLHRPGYSSRNPQNDNYLGVDCVKNRNGALFSTDLYFDGRYSEIRELEDHEQEQLNQIREDLNASNNNSGF